MRRMILFLMLAMCCTFGWAQESTLPRTIKIYPLNMFRAEFDLGYEHGIFPWLSFSGQVGYVGTGAFSQVNSGPRTGGEDCTYVWPVKGFGFRVGPRFYPTKTKRNAPFYVEWLLAYRRLQFPTLKEYPGDHCVETALEPGKEIRPLVQRLGMQVMLGGALRRDKKFTVDMFGGLGLHAVVTDEQQVVDPGNANEFYRVEPVYSRFATSIHMGFSLGYNFHGANKR